MARKRHKPTEPDPVRIIPVYDPTQVDLNVQWIALDPLNAGYAAAQATLAATASSVPSSYGTYAVSDGANGYTGLKIVGPFYMSNAQLSAAGLATIDGALVYDRVNFSKCINPQYAAPTTYTNQWGDSYTVYGKFNQQPQRIPTTGYERLLAYMKGLGSDTVLFVKRGGNGTKSGTSYLNAMDYKDIAAITGGTPTTDPTTYSIVVLIGTLSRYSNEGDQGGLVSGGGFRIKNGTSSTRTQVLAHPVDGAKLLYGANLGGTNGWGMDADFTNEGGGVWSMVIGSIVSLNTTSGFTLSDAGGTLRFLTKVSALSTCQSTTDSVFMDPDFSGGSDRIYIHLADGSNPKATTYVPTNIGGCWIDTTSTTYFDIYGVEFYQAAFTHKYGQSDFTLYACKLFAGTRLAHTQSTIDLNTGQWFSDSPSTSYIMQKPHLCSNRRYIGCEFWYFPDVMYDSCGGGANEYCPDGTVFRDNYVYGTGINIYGVNVANTDSHSCATFGGETNWSIVNNCFERAGWYTILPYVVIAAPEDPARVITDAAITNGTFNSDVSGWTDLSSGGSSISWSAGKLRLTSVSDALAKAEQAVTVGSGYRARTGSAATSSGTTVTLDGSPDLSGIITTVGLTQTSFTITGGNNSDQHGSYFYITGVDNTAKTITTDRAVGISTTCSWYIGKKHVLKFTTTPLAIISVSIGTSSGGTQILNSIPCTADADGQCAIDFLPTTATFYIQFHRSTTGTYDIDNVNLLTSLANEPAFTQAMPTSKRFALPSPDNRTLYSSPHYGITIQYNRIINPLTVNDNSSLGVDGELISMEGDTLCYGYNNQCHGVKITDNRIEHNQQLLASGIRGKWKLSSPYDQTQVEIARNTIRGVLRGFYVFGTSTDENGNTVESSWYFHDNDIYAVDNGATPGYFIQTVNVLNTSQHNQVSDNNTFRSGGGGAWFSQSTEYTTIAAWRAAQPTGDTYDPNSTVKVLGA